MLLAVLYAGGLRISELVGLSWADVIVRDDKVQLSVTGKGGKVRQVLLPETVSKSLLALRGDAGANDPVFASRTGTRLKQRAIGYMIKGAAKRAGIGESVSPIGCAMPMARIRSTAAPPLPRCRPRSATPTWRRRAAICTRGRTPRAGSSWTRAFFVEEDDDA